MPIISMTTEQRLRRIRTLQYIVASRWFLHAGIVVLGLTQKAIGVAEFDPIIFLLILFTYSYNLIFYIYLHRKPSKITVRGLYYIGLLQVVLDQIVYSIVLYGSGGVESLSFMFYLMTIFIAIVLFNELEIIAITFFTIILYVSVITLEYKDIIPHFDRYNFDPGFYQNIGVTVHNGATVVMMLVFTAFFAAFISNLIRSREAGIRSERDKIAAIVDNLVDGVIMLNKRGRVILMNPYAQRVLHISIDEHRNKQLKPDDFAEPLHELIEFISSTTDEVVYRNKEFVIEEAGDRVVLQATTLSMISQEDIRIGSLIILHNITREKDLDQMKSDFISVAAHQLRTPLATLKWLFKIMLDGDGGELNAKQRDLMTKGYRRNNEVIEIVNNLLDVSEIEDGRFPYKFVEDSLLPLVEQVISNVQDTAHTKGVKIEFATDEKLPQVNIDRQKIKMAIQNLVDNAIKYSQPSTTLHIELRMRDNGVELTIQDEGIGMSEETKQKVFTKFYRGKEAITIDPTGSGLGLYIVRSIVDHHGGIIEYESTLGKGTSFTIYLPKIEDFE